MLGWTVADTDRSVNTDQSVEDVFFNFSGGTREPDSSSLGLLKLETLESQKLTILSFEVFS